MELFYRSKGLCNVGVDFFVSPPCALARRACLSPRVGVSAILNSVPPPTKSYDQAELALRAGRSFLGKGFGLGSAGNRDAFKSRTQTNLWEIIQVHFGVIIPVPLLPNSLNRRVSTLTIQWVSRKTTSTWLTMKTAGEKLLQLVTYFENFRSTNMNS